MTTGKAILIVTTYLRDDGDDIVEDVQQRSEPMPRDRAESALAALLTYHRGCGHSVTEKAMHAGTWMERVKWVVRDPSLAGPPDNKESASGLTHIYWLCDETDSMYAEALDRLVTDIPAPLATTDGAA